MTRPYNAKTMNKLFRLLPTLLVFFIIISFTTCKAQHDDDDDLPDFEFYKTNNKDVTKAKNEEEEAKNELKQQETLFTHKEKKIRQVLLRALSNGQLRRKFSEVMPVLRMMTKQQRLALAALIQAQVVGNRTLTLEQVSVCIKE